MERKTRTLRSNQIILKNSFEYKELNDVESFECKQVF